MADMVFSLDWLSLTVWLSKDMLIAVYLDILGLHEGLEFSGHGGIGFQELHFGKHGFQLYAAPVNAKDGAEYCSLRFSGECLHAIGMDALVEFYTALCVDNIRFNCTRLDVAFDTQSFTVAQVEESRSAGLLTCKASTFRPIRDYQGNELRGHTLYFGSRQSSAMLRVYYKTDGHSFGDQPFTRVEMELKGERATFGLLELMAAEMCHWSSMAGAWLNAFIQIGADWWHAFVEGFKTAWLRLSRPPQTLERMGNWIRRQVAPTLACYLAAKTGGEVGEMFDIFGDLMRQGLTRLHGVKDRIARDGGAQIEDTLIFLEACAVEF